MACEMGAFHYRHRYHSSHTCEMRDINDLRNHRVQLLAMVFARGGLRQNIIRYLR